MFTLDFSSRLPIYEQLYESVLRMAAIGALESGESLPSVRTAAQELGVNPNTVQKAYGMLERDGVIHSVPGKGSFLSESETARKLQRKIVEKNLTETIHSAAECGIRREEIIAKISECFNGRDEQA